MQFTNHEHTPYKRHGAGFYEVQGAHKSSCFPIVLYDHEQLMPEMTGPMWTKSQLSLLVHLSVTLQLA